jgi:type I restriction enzyme S subunit
VFDWKFFNGLLGFSSFLELNAVGTTMLNLSPAIVGRMLVPVPPLAEQQAIIGFLDRGTAQLDALTVKVETAIAINQAHKHTPFCYNVCMDKIDARMTPDHVRSYFRHPLARYTACI